MLYFFADVFPYFLFFYKLNMDIHPTKIDEKSIFLFINVSLSPITGGISIVQIIPFFWCCKNAWIHHIRQLLKKIENIVE